MRWKCNMMLKTNCYRDLADSLALSKKYFRLIKKTKKQIFLLKKRINLKIMLTFSNSYYQQKIIFFIVCTFSLKLA